MKRLRISSSVNLHSGSRENPIEYFAQGLAFMRAMGFDAADMPSFFFSAAADEPEKAVEKVEEPVKAKEPETKAQPKPVDKAKKAPANKSRKAGSNK